MGVGRDIEERLAWRNKTPFYPTPTHPLTLPCDELSQQVLHSGSQAARGNDCWAERCLMKVETLVIIIVLLVVLVDAVSLRSRRGPFHLSVRITEAWAKHLNPHANQKEMMCSDSLSFT